MEDMITHVLIDLLLKVYLEFFHFSFTDGKMSFVKIVFGFEDFEFE